MRILLFLLAAAVLVGLLLFRILAAIYLQVVDSHIAMFGILTVTLEGLTMALKLTDVSIDLLTLLPKTHDDALESRFFLGEVTIIFVFALLV